MTTPSTARADGGRYFALRLCAVAGILAFLAAAGGGLYYRYQRERLRSSVWRELEGIAELKARQVSDWRNERLNDARFLMVTPSIARDIGAYLKQPESDAARAAVVGWLNAMRSGGRYDSMLLVDRSMSVQLALPTESPTPGSPLRGMLAETFANGQLTLTDLHHRTPIEPLHLDVLIPIFTFEEVSQTDPAPAGNRRLPVAVIVMRLNPDRSIYPLLEAREHRGKSTETLLVRREGDRVMFLSRRRYGQTMAASSPIDRPLLPAAMAARGETGAREGIDYRGVPVLSALHRIPETPWLLVVKMDQSEAYAAVREEAWSVGISVGLLLAAIASGTAYLWRARNLHVLRRTLEAEQTARALAERLALITRNANDIILLIDDELRILEGNDRALAAYGYTIEEIRRLSVSDIRAPGSETQMAMEVSRVRAAGNAVFETLHRRKDGTVFPVEVSARTVALDGRPHLLSVIRDITDRKRAEAELARVNRALRTLSECNQALVRAKDEDELLRRVCETIVQHGGYRMVWVGYAMDDVDRSVKLMARAGYEDADLATVRITWADTEHGWGPTGTCLRTGELAVCQDLATDPRLAAWRDQIVRHGYRSAIALPLRGGGHTFGALTIIAADAGALHEEERQLLCELADDLTFGILALRNKGERQQAVASLAASEERFRLFFDSSLDAVLLTEVDGRVLSANPAACALFSCSEGELRQATRAEIVDTSDPRLPALLEQRASLGQARGELRFLRHDGTPFETEVAAATFRDRDGRTCSSMIIRDITTRKQVEAELHHRLQLQDQLAKVASTVPGMIFTFRLRPDGTTCLPFCTPVIADLWGYTPEELREDFTPALARVHEADRAPLMASITESARTNSIWSRDFRVRHPSKGELWLEGQSVPRAEADGGVVWHGFVQDVTERKRAEHALREQEAAYRELVQNANSAIIRWRRDGTIAFFNEYAQALFGYTAEEVVGRHVSMLLPTQESNEGELSTLVQNIVDDPVGYGSNVNENVCRDGRRVWMAWTNRALLDANGQVRELLAIGSDVTRLKEAEAALRRNEADLARAMTLAHIAHWEYEISSACFTFNDRFYALNGTAADREGGYRMSGARFAEEFVVPEDRHHVSDAVQRALTVKPGDDEWQLELRIRRRDGEIRHVVVHLSLARAADGHAVTIRGAVQDVTQRKQAEEALRESEERLRLFIQHAPVALAMFDREMCYIEVSRRWLTDYRLGDRDLKGQSHYTVFPKIGERFKAVHRRAFEGEVARSDEDEFVRADGSSQWLRWEVRPWRNAAGAVGGIVIFSEDISERKRAEVALATQMQELRRWHSVTLGREMRVLELKAEVNRLLATAGQPARYASATQIPAAEGGQA